MRRYILPIAALAVAFAASARAEITECTNITAVQITISVQGVYCLKQNIGTSITSGNAITITANNVTIDFNGYKLGGLGAGPGTNARGIEADDRRNITVRNGSIRGFRYGIVFDGNSTTSSGHLIEDMILDSNTFYALFVVGDGVVVRNNRIIDTGSSAQYGTAHAITVQSSSRTVVEDNLIAGVNETATAIGIQVNASSLINLTRNRILDVRNAGTIRGIGVYSTTGISIVGNHLANTTTAGNGIVETLGAVDMSCIDNFVEGFSTAITGCDYLSGNHTP